MHISRKRREKVVLSRKQAQEIVSCLSYVPFVLIAEQKSS